MIKNIDNKKNEKMKNQKQEKHNTYFYCLFFSCFQIDGIDAFWATIQMLKNGACGGPGLCERPIDLF